MVTADSKSSASDPFFGQVVIKWGNHNTCTSLSQNKSLQHYQQCFLVSERERKKLKQYVYTYVYIYIYIHTYIAYMYTYIILKHIYNIYIYTDTNLPLECILESPAPNPRPLAVPSPLLFHLRFSNSSHICFTDFV